MERKLKNFWITSLSLLLLSPAALASNDQWEGLLKKLFGNKKSISLTAVRNVPKSVSFRGIVEVPSYLSIFSGYGMVHPSAGQLIFDNQIVCNYSPSSHHSSSKKIYSLQNCSDNSRARDDMNVVSKIELRLNHASSTNAALKASIKVIRSDRVEYGLTFPIDAQEGQILMYNGEAWVAADASELDLQGLQGEAGAPGEMGPQGFQGPQGAAGPQGEKGDKGDKGDAGVAGAAGSIGPMGPAGAAGTIGPQGPKGDAGSAGAAGSVGPMGPAGAIGPQGPKGDAGSAGSVGATGSVGPMGPAGNDGASGVAGSMGPQGPKGDAGTQGPAGATGAMGPMGPMGFQGPAGVDGQDGAAGPAGAQGVKGDKGDKGDRGLSQIAYLRDERLSGVPAGTCNANSWQPRTLNTLGGTSGFASLSGNRFILTPGKYFVEISVPAYQVAMSQAKLVVIESGLDVLWGSSAFSHQTSPSVSYSNIQGELIVDQTSTFEIQQNCASVRVNTGMGVPSGFGREIYTQVKIIKTE